MAPPRTTRRSAQNVEFQELPETSRRASARDKVPFTDEKKAAARQYILSILMAEQTYVDPNTLKQTLKEDPKWQELIAGISPSAVSKFVNTILANVQKRTVKAKTLFPAATVRMNVYKNSAYNDIKTLLNTKKLSNSDREEVGLALNDPESTLFQSVLDMITYLRSEPGLRELVDIIDNPKFDINTNKNGHTLLFHTLLTMHTSTHDSLLKRLASHIISKKPDVTIQATAMIPVSGIVLKITCTQMMFALALMAYSNNRLNIFDLVTQMAKLKKLPDLYITPQKTYGTVTTPDGLVTPINNIWLLRIFYNNAPYLINTLKLDLKNGEGNRTVKETVLAKVSEYDTQRDLLEAEILALENLANEKENELTKTRVNLRQMRTIELTLNRLRD